MRRQPNLVGKVLAGLEKRRCFRFLRDAEVCGALLAVRLAACCRAACTNLSKVEPPTLAHSYSMSVTVEPPGAQQLEVRLQALTQQVKELEEQNERLMSLEKERASLMLAACKLPAPTCSCPHAQLLADAVVRNCESHG